MIDPKTLNLHRTGARRRGVVASAAALLLVALALAPAAARAQHRELLSRFVQSDNAAANSAFDLGRAYLSEEKWDRAAAVLTRYVVDLRSRRYYAAGCYLAVEIPQVDRYYYQTEAAARADGYLPGECS